MSTVRLNITLPRELSKKLDKLAGPRKKSRFISDSIAERIRQIQSEQLEDQLEEGYKATKEEALTLTREFEAADLEGWDDY